MISRITVNMSYRGKKYCITVNYDDEATRLQLDNGFQWEGEVKQWIVNNNPMKEIMTKESHRKLAMATRFQGSILVDLETERSDTAPCRIEQRRAVCTE